MYTEDGKPRDVIGGTLTVYVEDRASPNLIARENYIYGFQAIPTSAMLSQPEFGRSNPAKTRNQRLAVLVSFAKIVCFIYPEKQKLIDSIHTISCIRANFEKPGLVKEAFCKLGILTPERLYH